MYMLSFSPEPATSIVAPLAITVNETDSATFTCSVSGVPLPSITWTLPDGSNITAVDQQSEILPRVFAETFTSEEAPYEAMSILTITSASRIDEGVYTCNAVNDDSMTSSTGTLTVQGKLPISITFIIVQVISMHLCHFELLVASHFPCSTTSCASRCSASTGFGTRRYYDQLLHQ